MSMNWTRLLIASLVVTVALPAFADRRDRRERREDRREERRDNRQERREDRRDNRQDRREERWDRRQDRRQDRRDARWDRRDNRWNGPRRAPPARRVERWAPRRGYTWVGGHWDWRGNDYVWVSGRYERERRGQRWRDRRWEMRDGAYVVVDGGWVSIGPSSAPPAVRVERWSPRSGYVWVNGYWDWQGDQWAWVPGHYERERRGQIYRSPRWEQRNGAWVTVQGGWGVR